MYDVFDYQPKKIFDIILLDPPCTATGTIGKNPDLQFLDPVDKLEELSDIQQKMLERCARWLQMMVFNLFCLLSPKRGGREPDK